MSLERKLHVSSGALDAPAVLAYLNGEPGAELVSTVLTDAVISARNASEVLARLMETASPERAREEFDLLKLEVVPFDLQQAHDAADLRAPTRPAGLLLGDRAYLGLARALGLPVFTADRNWARIDVGVDVRLIR